MSHAFKTQYSPHTMFDRSPPASVVWRFCRGLEAPGRISWRCVLLPLRAATGGEPREAIFDPIIFGQGKTLGRAQRLQPVPAVPPKKKDARVPGVAEGA